jgi:hypothetical protein
MSDIATYDEKRRTIKQKFLSRAISEGRGHEAIKKIDALYRNVRATMEGTDDDIIGDLSARATDGKNRATLSDLQAAAIGSSTNSKYLRAFNMAQALLGTSHRLVESDIMPAPPGLQ